MKYFKANATEKEQINKAVLLMRFRTETPTKKSLKYSTYKVIS